MRNEKFSFNVLGCILFTLIITFSYPLFAVAEEKKDQIKSSVLSDKQFETEMIEEIKSFSKTQNIKSGNTLNIESIVEKYIPVRGTQKEILSSIVANGFKLYSVPVEGEGVYAASFEYHRFLQFLFRREIRIVLYFDNNKLVRYKAIEFVHTL